MTEAERHARDVHHLLQQRDGISVSGVREVREDEWMLTVHNHPLTVHGLVTDDRLLITGHHPDQTFQRGTAWVSAELLLDSVGAHPARTLQVDDRGDLVFRDPKTDIPGGLRGEDGPWD